MRKIILQMIVTLDGCFAGPNGEADWHVVDAEYNEYALNTLRSVGGLLFGRKTYELMASYWPTPNANEKDPEVARLMNGLPKFVFSRSMDEPSWENTVLIRGDAVERLRELKQQPGKDLAIFGSSELAVTLIPSRLIDEYRFMVNPLVYGSGKPLFSGIQDRVRLELTETKAFRSGNVLLTYRQPKP